MAAATSVVAAGRGAVVVVPPTAVPGNQELISKLRNGVKVNLFEKFVAQIEKIFFFMKNLKEKN